MKPGLMKLVLALGFMALAGCASKQTTLYDWGPYDNQVYAYFKNESPQEQILILEQHAQQAQARGRQLPPGYRAHLGLLYARAGRETEFVAALQQEKIFFPESAPYIDRLLIMTKSKKTNHDAQN